MNHHRLSDYVLTLGPLVVSSSLADDPAITQVTYDSRQVIPGALFICKGAHFQPDYLLHALERGAVAYLSDTPYPQVASVPWITVTDIRQAIAQAGSLFYDQDWQALTLLGVTGTKGKTTTTIMLHSILAAWMRRNSGPRPGIISSLRNEDGAASATPVHTTPETLDLYQHLHNAVTAGLRQVCLEVSSQALRYRRVDNLRFEASCFLNVSEDHISPKEHPDYDDYLQAKLQLFDQSRLAVVNARTADLARVLAATEKCQKVVTFARQEPGTDWLDADVVAYDLVEQGSCQEFTVRAHDGVEKLSIRLVGQFNVDNALAAISMARLLDVPWDLIREGLAEAHIPGRMEVFRLCGGKTVIVDYAHQKLSIETLLAWAKEHYRSAHLTMVFGSVGDKALNRRQELGTLAGQWADDIYLTEDDPGEVPVDEICDELNQYIQSTGHRPGQIVLDRTEAIHQAITNSPDDGLVLVIGKGAETRQIRGQIHVPILSDIEVVRRYAAEQAD